MAYTDCSCSKTTQWGASIPLPNGDSTRPTKALQSKFSPFCPTKTPAKSHNHSHPNDNGNGNGNGNDIIRTYGTIHDPSSLTNTPKCDAGDVALRGGLCCRQIKDSDTRTLVDPDVVRDIIIGLTDGLTVPFALTAGLSGVGSTSLVLIAGLAELVSGAISMGIGGFLSAQAELQHYKFMVQRTQERVLQSCSSAVVDEVCDILGPYGVPQDVAAMVAIRLADAEGSGAPKGLHTTRTNNDDDDEAATALLAPSIADDQGLTSFILRVGKGLEPITASRAWQSAMTIGLSYFLGGLLPLCPYILFDLVSRALFSSVAVTAVTLLLFGVVKQRYTGGAAGLKGYAYGAISTLAVGGLAAGASWAIVRAFESEDAV